VTNPNPLAAKIIASAADRELDEDSREKWSFAFNSASKRAIFPCHCRIGPLTDTNRFLKMDIPDMQKLCVHLNEFALPRAIVDLDQQRFLAWNTRFLARTGYSEEEIKTLDPGKAILQSDSSFFPLDEGDNPTAEFVALAVRVPARTAAVPGHLVKSKGKLGYLMLNDIEPATSTKFEQGRLVGQEQERVRILQMFHDEVSSDMLGALFKIQIAKEKLESAQSPEVGPVAEASEMLSEAVEKIGDVLEGRKPHPGN
jgi:PAS domain-containing protein